MWNFEASNFEIRGDIFHFGRLSDEKFLRIGFHKTCHIFRFHGIANIPSYVFHISFRQKISKYWFPHDLSFFQIWRNYKYFKFWISHFLIELPIIFRQKFSRYRFPQDLSYFRISRNWLYSKICFPHFLFGIPICVRQNFSKHWFPQDLSYNGWKRNCKYSKLCFPHFLFDIPSSVRLVIFWKSK